MRVKLSKPFFQTSPDKYLSKVFADGWLGTGPLVAEFEKRFAEYVGCKYFIATSSGTMALQLCYDALNFSNREILIPSLTYIATLQPLLAIRATPLFIDVQKEDGNTNLQDIQNKITENTAGIVLVHYSGNVTDDLSKIFDFANHRGLPILQDAAHCVGVLYNGKHIGSDSLACFSFGPIKQITSGTGGGISTNDEELAAKLRIKRSLGITQETWDRTLKNNTKYNVISTGYRGAMSDISAAIGLAQLDDLPMILARRREMLQYYDSHLTESCYVKLSRRPETKSLYLYPIILNNNIDRQSVIEYMNSKEIEVGIHYPPIHLEPIIDNPPLLPITQYLNQHLITIPFHNNLSDDDLKYVVDALDSYPGV